MSLYEKKNDSRFHKSSILVPLFFMILFIILIYIPFFIGLLLLASYIIKTNHLVFFQNLGIWGELLIAFFIIIGWIGVALAFSALPYWILRTKGRYILAEKVMIVIRVLLFHIFMFPWLCWTMLRNNSTFLRQRYRNKLKKLVNSQKMQERKIERSKRLQRKIHSL